MIFPLKARQAKTRNITLLILSLILLGLAVAPTRTAASQVPSGQTGLGPSPSASAACLKPIPEDSSTQPVLPSVTDSPVSGNVVPIVRDGRASYLREMPAGFVLSMEVVFKLRHAEQFKKCLQSISDPSSPNYGHWLNSETLQPYLPTPGQKASIVSFLSNNGFNVSEGPSPLVLRLSATVGTIEQNLGVRIVLYQGEQGRDFYAANADPKLPENMAALVNGILGLDNYVSVGPSETPCTSPFCPQGIQVGYGLSTLAGRGLDGTGQKVAIVDAPGDPDPQAAINTFSTQYSLPATTLDIRFPDGSPSSYNPGWASETTLDLAAVHSAAPGAGIILLYCKGDLLDCDDYVATNSLTTIVSNSWTYICGTVSCSDTQLSSSLVSSHDSRLAMDASQGLTMLFATGDQGAKPDGTNLGAEFPASDPNVLAVGATNLALTGCGTTTCTGYGSETGASISGGGYSGVFSEPSWQTAAIGSVSGRAVPDVSMLGLSPGIWTYSTLSDMCGSATGRNGQPPPAAGWFGCSGTSLATPLWAGFLSVAVQMRGGSGFGNIDPTIWQIASGPSYSLDFRDVTSGSNNGYSAAIGWDPVTGWGTPVADSLGYTLAGFDFSMSASPSDVTALAGQPASFSVALTRVSGLASPVSLTLSGQPLGATTLFSPNPATPTMNSMLQVTTSSLGDFVLTVHAQGGGITHTTTVNLHIYDFTIAITPADRTCLRGCSASYTATLTLIPGSSTVGVPVVSLGVSGLPGDATHGLAGSLTPTFPGASASLTVGTAIAPGGSLGDFPFTVTGTDNVNPGGGSRQGSGALHIYDFTIAASPTNQLILTTGSNSYSVTVALVPGSSTTGLPSIILSIAGLPNDATHSFSLGSGPADGFASLLTITTSNSPSGAYTLTITGTDTRSPEGGQRSTSPTLTVLTLQQALQLIINQINSFQSSGVLTSGQANSLMVKLSMAITNLNRGMNTVACNQLAAFVNQVNSYVAEGVLTPAQANILLAGSLGVNAIKAAIPC